MNGQQSESGAPRDEFNLDFTRPPAPVEGQLDYESTVTAPTEWVPYVYTDSEIQALTERRQLSTASIVCGLLGLLGAVFGVWGMLFSLAAVILALIGRRTERMAGHLWVLGLVAGLVGVAIAAGWIVLITAVFPGRL